MTTPTLFGPEFLVNTTTQGSQSSPVVAGLANGKFVTVWEDDSTPGPNGFETIRMQMFNADGSKHGTEFIVNGNEVSDARVPGVTALSDGRFGNEFLINESTATSRRSPR